ncbi:MAG TPA: hypothetical protein VNT02_00515 [Burkholderiales bacterium]|nr:hypothetical protein [Burkholderiales bacterium]
MCSVHDTIELEKRGIPATVIITQAFRNAAVFQFRSKGMEGHPYIELPHPISNLKPDDMRELTLSYVDRLAAQLVA